MRKTLTFPQLVVAGVAAAGVVVAQAASQLSAAGWAVLATCVVAAVATTVVWRIRRYRQRRLTLIRKYGDLDIVDCIMNRTVWKGETAEQLRESLGSPAAIDDQLRKTGKRQIWKYQRVGRNRYRQRVVLEDDIVVGWDAKG